MHDVPRLISISGKAGAGKTTLTKALDQQLRALGWRRQTISFAEPVKSVSRQVLLALGLIDPLDREAVWKQKYRCVPQVLGTHLRTFSQDVWVQIAVDRIVEAQKDPRMIVLNDDCRFRNEAQALRGIGGQLVRITADTQLRRERLGKPIDEVHPSETDLDRFKDWDLEIFQTKEQCGTPEGYATQVLRHWNFHPYTTQSTI